jgi:hypothetical protein
MFVKGTGTRNLSLIRNINHACEIWLPFVQKVLELFTNKSITVQFKEFIEI